MTKENRQFFLSLRICPRCEREKLFGDETVCPECRAKRATYNQQYYAKNKGRWSSTEAQKKRRALLKSKGLCVDCGKLKAVNGGSRCPVCREKYRIYQYK